MDKDLGVFFDWMKAEGHYDNTVIIITSDHGEEFFEHGGWWHGTTLFEEQIHVPLIIKLPNQEQAGERIPWQVRVIDIAPTVATLAGAPLPPMWQGEPLFNAEYEAGLALMKAPPVDEEAVVQEDAGLSEDVAQAPDLSSFDRLVYAQENFEGYVLEAVRAFGWKYIVAANPEGAEEDGKRALPSRSLFDMSTPAPDEMTNRAGEGMAVQGRLEKLAREQNKMAQDAAVGAVKMQASASEEERMRALGYLD